MVYTATLTSAGQITIPKGVREILGVKPGEKIVFSSDKDSVFIAREKSASEIAEEIDKMIPTDIRRRHMEEYAGMTSAEMREKWAASEDGWDFIRGEMERTL